MPDQRKSGSSKIITFYSYKGGTGRSMALANVAWILASTGRRVLVIDWDLEAPGLHRYFQPFLVDPDVIDTDGLIDYMWHLTSTVMSVQPDATPAIPDLLDYRVGIEWDFPLGGSLDFIPAGRQGDNYAQRVNAFDWDNFYSRLGGGRLLQTARERMKEGYDFVLIDSRTGVSDTSGICTVQLPDVVVALFTLNNQSMEGVAAILDSVIALRAQSNDRPLAVFPVVSRVEDGEQTKLEISRQRCRQVFARFVGDASELRARRYWDDMEIPYKKFYAYEEVLATFGDAAGAEGSKSSLLSAIERLARRATQIDELAMPPVPRAVRREILAKYGDTELEPEDTPPVTEIYSPDIPFELGFVLAGGGSGGVYTAGVMDFMFEALQAWEDARGRGEDVPPHRVQLRVIAGASADGLTAAIATAALGSDIPRAPRDPGVGPSGNRFYRAWVEDMDIRALLGVEDLADRQAHVGSLLDSSLLDRVGAQAFAGMDGKPRDRAFVADPLEVILTIANLQGVPYRFRFSGRTTRGHSIVRHADHRRFLRSRVAPERSGSGWLDLANVGSEAWNDLREAALAAGSVPLGLMPRHLKRPRKDYDVMTWRVPGQGEIGEPCYREEQVQPSWPMGSGSIAEYPFLAVDGGLISSDPLELARRALAGKDRSNPRTAERAHRAVLMVDPFCGHTWDGSVPEPRTYDLIDVFTLMFGALQEQARFRPDQLTLAESENVYSRFLITPARSLGDAQAPHPIASGMLGGFGGFLSARFRNHDFHLGRRNAQRFLARYFVLPLEAARMNPVFAQTSEATFQKYAVTRDGRDYYPLVPLCGSASVEVDRTPWASLAMPDAEVADIEERFAHRMEAVLGRICDKRVANWLVARGLKGFIRVKRGRWAKRVMRGVREGLETYSLGEHSLKRA